MTNGRLVDEATAPGRAALRRLAQALLLRPLLSSAVSVGVHGRDRLHDLAGTFVVVGNHASHLDTALVFTALPGRLSKRLATGAAADHFFTSRWRSLVPRLFFNVFPVDRPGRPLRGPSHKGLSATLLDRGVPLLIFPEGTRSRTGVMGPFSPGAARLCIQRRLPCVPAALVGTFDAWPAGRRLWRFGRPPVHVTFGHPIRPREGETFIAFTARVQREVLRLHDLTARAYGMKTMRELAASAVRRALPGRGGRGGRRRPGR